MSAVAAAPVKVVKRVSQCLAELTEMEYFNNKPERIGSPSFDDVVRQGDVYIMNIASLPLGQTSENRQLAEGDTQGSRHILTGKVNIIDKVTCVVKNLDGVAIHPTLVGPAFECVSDVTETHPEHGHKILPAGTCWQVVFQQSLAEEVRRVRD